MPRRMKSEVPQWIRLASASSPRRLVLLAALWFAALFPPSARCEELTVQADLWCHYNCEPQSAAPGYIVEVLQAIYGPKNIGIRYEVVPWDRALILVHDGKADAAIGATQNEVNNFSLLIGREAIGFSSDCLFVGAGSKVRFNSVEDLNSLKRIGLASGYSYSNEVDTWLKRPGNRDRIFVQKGENPAAINAKNLALGRLDGVIEDDHVMRHLLGKLGLEREVSLAGCQKQTKIFVAFSPKLKNVQQVIKTFDDGVVALRESQQLAKILAKYGLSDWK